MQYFQSVPGVGSLSGHLRAAVSDRAEARADRRMAGQCCAAPPGAGGTGLRPQMAEPPVRWYRASTTPTHLLPPARPPHQPGDPWARYRVGLYCNCLCLYCSGEVRCKQRWYAREQAAIRPQRPVLCARPYGRPAAKVQREQRQDRVDGLTMPGRQPQATEPANRASAGSADRKLWGCGTRRRIPFWHSIEPVYNAQYYVQQTDWYR